MKNPLTCVSSGQTVPALRESTITILDPSYPLLLKEIPDPPFALHFRGDPSLLSLPSIALVGSRRASTYGLAAARELSRELAGAGLAIVSGLARGIDATAHASALEAGGKTIAVLGTGIDILYPRDNRALFTRIEKEGLLVSEFRPGTPPLKENFPIRNRVISGLSLGTVIVEATSRSGSLITARLAAEQNREVFAVPGTIFSAGAEGPNRLIQYGAKLVHDVDDVLEELRGDFRRKARAKSEDVSPELAVVLQALRKDEATHVETLAGTLALTPGDLASRLLQLELEERIRALPGARYVKL